MEYFRGNINLSGKKDVCVKIIIMVIRRRNTHASSVIGLP